ncbi:MAG: ATP-binding protein [Flavobacteriales bacterium]
MKRTSMQQFRMTAAKLLAALCLLSLPGHAFSSDAVKLWKRTNVMFGRLELPRLHSLLDSLHHIPNVNGDLAAIAQVIEVRLALREGRLIEAYKKIQEAFGSHEERSPFVQLVVMKEQTSVLKAMQLMDKAEEAALRAYQYARSVGQAEHEAELLVLMAEIDRRKGRPEECLEKLIEAETLATDSGYARVLCNVYLNRGNLFYDQERFQEAMEAYVAALGCAEGSGMLDIAQNAALNIGSAMYFLNEPSEVIAFYDSVLATSPMAASAPFEADVRGNIGMVANDAGDHRRAYKELHRAIDLYLSLADTSNAANSYLYLSNTFMGIGKLDSAYAAAQRSLEISTMIGAKELVADAEIRLSQILDRMGRSHEAIEHMEQGHEIRSELTREKHSERMSFLEIQFDTEKKEQELLLSNAELKVSIEAEQARRAQRNWLIGITALLVLLAVVLYRNYSGQKRLRTQEQALHEREVNDLLKEQEINSLDAMMKGQEQERQRVGKDLHDRVGSMLSAVKLQFSALEGRMEQMETHQREKYEHVFSLLDETVTEVRRISHNMVRGTISQFGLGRALEDLRSAVHVPGKLDVTLSLFGMEERLDQDLEIAAYRMVQECVSNVMKHAHAKELTIQLTRTTAALNMLVEDDGRGFEMTAIEAGLGMSNIRERAAAYNGSVNVDSRPGRGTSVSIDLPLTRLPELG